MPQAPPPDPREPLHTACWTSRVHAKTTLAGPALGALARVPGSTAGVALSDGAPRPAAGLPGATCLIGREMMSATTGNELRAGMDFRWRRDTERLGDAEPPPLP